MSNLRLFLALLVGMATPSFGWAGDSELREFQVFVDGRPCGSYSMTIEKLSDGSVSQTGRADIRVRVLIRNFVYTYSGQEYWKDGRLLRLDSTTNDDGQRYQLRATSGERGIELQVNGRQRLAPSNVWTTSYWQLPTRNRRFEELTLLDADNGRILRGKLHYVGPSPLSIEGKAIESFRYQLLGSRPADLWYDKDDRLVRQESLEDGHRTLLELTRIRKTKPN